MSALLEFKLLSIQLCPLFGSAGWVFLLIGVFLLRLCWFLTELISLHTHDGERPLALRLCGPPAR